MTPEQPTDPMQNCTPMSDQPATPSSKSSSSDNNDTEYEEYVSCFLESLGLNQNCKRMLNDDTKIFAHHNEKMGNNAVPIFQQAVKEDPKLFIEA